MKNYLLSTILSAVSVMAISNNNVEAKETFPVKIRIKVNQEVLTATMLDTETSRDFLSMLPLKMRMKDYSGAEKISDLPRRVSTENAPSGCDPSVGDIAYYSPWGNLAVFYNDSAYANGLIKLGSIDGGIEKLASGQGDFEAVFELMD